MMKAHMIALGCLVAALPALATTDWKAIKGSTGGDFEFLGSLCFDASEPGSRTTLSISIMTQDEAPDNLRLLFYDDQPDSFDMITRLALHQDSVSSSCAAKSEASKNFQSCQSGVDCQHGLEVGQMDRTKYGPTNTFCPNCWHYSRKVALTESTKRIWYFVASQCGSPTGVNITRFRINSAQAIDCGTIRAMYQTNSSAADTWGFTLFIFILMLNCATAYVFLIRSYYGNTNGPVSLEDLDDDGENDTFGADENEKYDQLL